MDSIMVQKNTEGGHAFKNDHTTSSSLELHNGGGQQWCYLVTFLYCMGNIVSWSSSRWVIRNIKAQIDA